MEKPTVVWFRVLREAMTQPPERDSEQYGGPCSILRMVHRHLVYFFPMFPLFLANFSGIYLVSWHSGKPGEGNGAGPQH